MLEKKDEIIHDLVKSIAVIQPTNTNVIGREQPCHQEESKQHQTGRKKDRSRQEHRYSRIPHVYYEKPVSTTKSKSTRDWDTDIGDRQDSTKINTRKTPVNTRGVVHPQIVKTNNRFDALSQGLENDETKTSECEEATSEPSFAEESSKTSRQDKASTPKLQPKVKSHIKPSFWNNKLPTKGNFTQSNSQLNREKVTIFSDSICSGMYGNDLTNRAKCCRVQVKAFNGATSSHLKSFTCCLHYKNSPRTQPFYISEQIVLEQRVARPQSQRKTSPMKSLIVLSRAKRMESRIS